MLTKRDFDESKKTQDGEVTMEKQKIIDLKIGD
jgi:hypothetical protein